MKYTNSVNRLIIMTLLSLGGFFHCQQIKDSLHLPQEEKTDAKPLNQIGVMHLQSIYGSSLPTMSMTSVQYLRKTNDEKATFIGRVNYRTRSGNSSLKYDLETYLKHGKKYYSFAGISVSDKEMFPGFEAFYSLYSSWNKGWELETGVKYLSASTFYLITPVLGASKEFGNNRLTLKNYFTFTKGNQYYGNSFTWKNFLNEERDNISLMTGFGNAPDSKNIDFSEDFISNKSKFIGLGYEKNLKSYKISTAAVYSNNHFSTGRKFNQFDMYLNLFYSFK